MGYRRSSELSRDGSLRGNDHNCQQETRRGSSPFFAFCAATAKALAPDATPFNAVLEFSYLHLVCDLQGTPYQIDALLAAKVGIFRVTGLRQLLSIIGFNFIATEDHATKELATALTFWLARGDVNGRGYFCSQACGGDFASRLDLDPFETLRVEGAVHFFETCSRSNN